MDYLACATELSSELIQIRHTIHKNPELGNKEFNTAVIIEKYLHECGITTKRILGTAVIGTLQCETQGPSVGLRADMDALPIQEETSVSFISQTNGIMHACGHDVHIVSVLGAAKILAQNRKCLRGNVYFIFQPDEEGNGGARRLIESGELDGIDAFFGLHVAPDLPLGTLGIRYGKFYAASDMFCVTVQGKSAHGASPEKGIDALEAAARMILGIKSIPRENVNDRSVISVGKMEAGDAGNIIPGYAKFSGIIRTLGNANREYTKRRISEIIKKIDEAMGTNTTLDIQQSYGGIVNSDVATSIVAQAAKKTFGPENIVEINNPLMTTEDFGYYIDFSSGSFYHLGAGCEQPLHNSQFLPDDKTVIYGAAMHATVIDEYLNSK